MPGRRSGEPGCGKMRRRRGMRLILRPALLLLLAEGDSHGYELIDQLDQMGFNTGCMDSSVFYRDLREMEEMALIRSSWDDDSKGPKKRVYQIEPEGWDRLQGWLDSLDAVKDQIDNLQARFQELNQAEEKK